MKENHPEAVILLEDGTMFRGKSIGKVGTAGGEICFNTGMTGYQEIYTDPSYFGQIIVNTNAHIGNYGTVSHEQESEHPQIRGIVVNEFSYKYSRKTADNSLNDYLKQANVVGITGLDTRKIVRHIRSKGAMNALISSEQLEEKSLKAKLDEVPSMQGLELSSMVTTSAPYFWGKEDKDALRIAVIDYGIKKSILNNFSRRNCYCKVFPAKTPFKELKDWRPDGYFLSNGPGDPASMDYAVEALTGMLDAKAPVFGICLGHQILGQAAGIPTYKMHHGHRGLNHPVKNLETNKGEITSQNHGFAVDNEKLDKTDNVKATHINLNDRTVEGIELKNKPAFSVQYHPEASPGPHDSRYLFDKFIDLIKSS